MGQSHKIYGSKHYHCNWDYTTCRYDNCSVHCTGPFIYLFMNKTPDSGTFKAVGVLPWQGCHTGGLHYFLLVQHFLLCIHSVSLAVLSQYWPENMAAADFQTFSKGIIFRRQNSVAKFCPHETLWNTKKAFKKYPNDVKMVNKEITRATVFTTS